MNKCFPHKLIRQFMTIPGMSRGYLDMLTDDIHESLVAGDQTGDLYRVGLNLVLSMMPLRHPATTIRILLDQFQSWWMLDPPVARAIALAIDELSVENTQSFQALSLDLELVRTWLAEDQRPIPSTAQLDFVTLVNMARDWQLQDTNKLLEAPVQWTSVLASEVLVYYAITPITSTRSLVTIAGGIEKLLISQAIVNSLVDGNMCMFAVSKVLHPGDWIGLVSIEKVQTNWCAGKVYMPDGAPAPQSLIRLGYQLAARYEAAELRHAQQRRVNHAMQLMTLTDMVIAIRGGNGKHAAVSDTPESNPIKRYVYIDTSSLLVQTERSAITEMINTSASESTAIIVGDTIEELDRLKHARPDMKQSVNAALRWIEFMLSNSRLKVEVAFDTPARPYADTALLRAVARHFEAASELYGAVTVITQDIALRLRLRARFAGHPLTTIDSRVLAPQTIQVRPTESGDVYGTRQDKPVDEIDRRQN